MPAPLGAFNKLKVKPCVGTSPSLAVAVNDSNAPSFTTRLPMAPSAGALFDSFTEIVIVSAALKAGEPLSVTRTVTLYEPGPCPSAGVHENAPPLVMTAPAGAFERLKVSPCAGKSESLAVAENDSNAPSFTVRLPTAPSTGALFASFTVIENDSVSANGAGRPLSTTRIVTGYTPGPCPSVGVQENNPVVG